MANDNAQNNVNEPKQKRGFKIPANPATTELKDIKKRQLERKTEGKPAEITNEVLYDMLFDVLENLARVENALNKQK